MLFWRLVHPDTTNIWFLSKKPSKLFIWDTGSDVPHAHTWPESLCETQLLNKLCWPADRRLGRTWRRAVSECVSRVGTSQQAFQTTVCMVRSCERNQPVASNAEQLSVSWVTEACCLLATIKHTAGPTLASNTHTDTNTHIHTNPLHPSSAVPPDQNSALDLMQAELFSGSSQTCISDDSRAFFFTHSGNK